MKIKFVHVVSTMCFFLKAAAQTASSGGARHNTRGGHPTEGWLSTWPLFVQWCARKNPARATLCTNMLATRKAFKVDFVPMVFETGEAMNEEGLQISQTNLTV